MNILTPSLSALDARSALSTVAMLMVLLPGVAWPCQAQAVQGFGLKLGPTSSSIADYELGDVHRRYGIAILGFVEWFDTRMISAVTEVGYVQRGFEEGPHEGRNEQNLPTGQFMLNTRFDYVSTAALARLEPIEGAVNPYVLLGPRLDFFLGGDTSFDSEAVRLPGVLEGGLVEAYRGIAFGAVAGLGLETPVSGGLTLMLELRLNIDVSNSLPDVPADARNNALDLLMGIRL